MTDLVPQPEDGRGRPPFEPNDEHRAVVERMVAAGVPLDRIRLAITNPDTGKAISRPTLMKCFQREIEIGRAKVDEVIGRHLLKHCETNFNACKFYIETHWGVTPAPAPVPAQSAPAAPVVAQAPDAPLVKTEATLDTARRIAFVLELAARGQFVEAPTAGTT